MLSKDMFWIILFIISIVLNIPIGVIFNKVGINWINAFIPFVNVLNYIRIVGLKKKYIVAFLMVIFCLFLSWDNFKWVWLYANWFYSGLLFRFDLLLLIPVCFAFWLVFWMSSALTLFICLMRAWKHCSLYHSMTSRVLLWSMFMFIYLIVFYGKLAYKFALKFWWKPWAAVLYIIFQPIAVWILAFWKREYKWVYFLKQNISSNETKSFFSEAKLFFKKNSKTFWQLFLKLIYFLLIVIFVGIILPFIVYVM